MSTKYQPKKGDRVRVVIEDTVTYSTTGGAFNLASGTIFATRDGVVSVEKLGPPVTVFKPGDRIRRLDGWDYEITLGTNGYLQHFTTGEVRYSRYNNREASGFDSSRYELVHPGGSK